MVQEGEKNSGGAAAPLLSAPMGNNYLFRNKQSHLGAVHKNVRRKSRKIYPSPLSAKFPELTQSPHPVCAGSPWILKNPIFFAPKSADVRFWRNSPLSCPQNVRRPHWTSAWLRKSFMDSPLLYNRTLRESTASS